MRPLFLFGFPAATPYRRPSTLLLFTLGSAPWRGLRTPVPRRQRSMSFCPSSCNCCSSTTRASCRLLPRVTFSPFLCMSSNAVISVTCVRAIHNGALAFW
ncbi:uncharacterized protein BDV14DRAFT_183670 [Aspergillus stella-maris]|uniref:uncharacterized protein n=1 Tax=Aspergillus stella-maris TaxID=1810926 RepID=UPI003CCDF6BC